MTAKGVLDFSIFDSQLNSISATQAQPPPIPQGVPNDHSYRFTMVVLADIDGDGKLDAVALYELFTYLNLRIGNSTARVFRGNGDGTFQQTGQDVSFGLAYSSLSVADLNGDGKPDLVSVGFNGPNLAVALGNGDGTFGTPSYSSILPATSVAIADVNADGKNDVIVASPTGVAVTLGNGDGTFGTPTIYDALSTNAPDPSISFPVLGNPPPTTSLAVADVNGDGTLDIVTNGVSVLFGDGKGGFSKRRDFLVNASGNVILTDFDGDGNIDVVLGDGNAQVLSGTSISVIFGDGTGNFADSPVLFNRSRVITGAAKGDFNHDGIPDIASITANSFTAAQGRGDGSFQPVFSYQFSDGVVTAVAVGDFNHDGTDDVAVAVSQGQTPLTPATTGYVAILLGKGDGTFSTPATVPISSAPMSLSTADLNGDGQIDVAVLTSQSVWIYFGKGDGTFANPVSYPTGTAPVSMILGDVNGDGFPDVIVTNQGACCDSSQANVMVWVNNRDGHFTAALPLMLRPALQINNFNPLAATAADFNRDGRLDLAISSSSSRNWTAILLGNGDGTFRAAGIYPVYGTSMIAGDFNGDGVPDLVEAADGPAPAFLLGKGDGTFTQQFLELPAFGSRELDGITASASFIAADFNGDGKVDLLGHVGGIGP